MTQTVSRILSCVLVLVLCGVMTSAFGYQIVTGQNPCPFCFLQRLAMIGVAFGQMLNFRFGIKMSHHAISIFHCIFGASVSLRQISLHICPGFGTYGTPVLGFGLYTWAFIVFVCALIGLGIIMWLYNPKWKQQHSKPLDYLERFVSIYLFAILVIDIAIAPGICGWICPDNP